MASSEKYDEIEINNQFYKRCWDTCTQKALDFLKHDLAVTIKSLGTTNDQAIDIAESLCRGEELADLINCDFESTEYKKTEEEAEKVLAKRDEKFIFISAPVKIGEEQKREEQFESFKKLHPYFQLGAINENITVYSKEELTSKIAKAFQSHHGIVTLVFNGHGGKEGTLLFKAKDGVRSTMKNVDFVKYIEELKKSNSKLLCRVIFAQCFAHKHDGSECIDVIHFTSQESPYTNNKWDEINGIWIHVELNKLAQKLLDEEKDEPEIHARDFITDPEETADLTL